MTKHLSSAGMLCQITPRNRRRHFAPRRIVLPEEWSATLHPGYALEAKRRKPHRLT